MPKLWMGGVGTLCAIAHYRVALFGLRIHEGSHQKDLSVNKLERSINFACFSAHLFYSIHLGIGMPFL